MDIKKIEALIETIDLGSINKAAEELGYTQSGLTYTINTLENEMGIKLLSRTHRGIALTTEGEVLLPYLKTIVQNMKTIDDEIKKMNTVVGKVIRIGAYSSLVINWLPAVIGNYSSKHPNVQFEIRTGVLNLTKWLDDNLIDIAICEEYLSGDNPWKAIAEDEMCVAIHRSLPLASEDMITLEKLNDYHVVFPSLLTQNAVAMKLKESGITFDNQTQFYTEDGSATLSMVELTKGVSFLSRQYEHECPENVVLKPLLPPIRRTLGYATNKRTGSSQYIKEFIQYIRRFDFE